MNYTGFGEKEKDKSLDMVLRFRKVSIYIQSTKSL